MVTQLHSWSIAYRFNYACTPYHLEDNTFLAAPRDLRVNGIALDPLSWPDASLETAHALSSLFPLQPAKYGRGLTPVEFAHPAIAKRLAHGPFARDNTVQFSRTRSDHSKRPACPRVIRGVRVRHALSSPSLHGWLQSGGKLALQLVHQML